MIKIKIFLIKAINGYILIIKLLNKKSYKKNK